MATIEEVKAELERRGAQDVNSLPMTLPDPEPHEMTRGHRVYWNRLRGYVRKYHDLVTYRDNEESAAAIVDRIWPESANLGPEDPWSCDGVEAEMRRRGATGIRIRHSGSGLHCASWNEHITHGSGVCFGFECDDGKTNGQIADTIWPESVRRDTEVVLACPADEDKRAAAVRMVEEINKRTQVPMRAELGADGVSVDLIQPVAGSDGADITIVNPATTCADCGGELRNDTCVECTERSMMNEAYRWANEGLSEVLGQGATTDVDDLELQPASINGIPMPMPTIPKLPGMSITFPDITGRGKQHVIGIDWAYDTPEGIAVGIKSGHAPHTDCPLPGCWLCTMPRGNGWFPGELEGRIERLGRGVRVMMHGVASVVTGAETFSDSAGIGRRFGVTLKEVK